MAEFAGRLCTVTFNSVAVVAREKSITMNGEPIDVTDDSSGG